jgi:hypothetical protein
MVPNRWAQLREFRNLYGPELTDISDATLTVHFSRADKESKRHSAGGVRYFAHALRPRTTEETPFDSVARFVELSSPGSLYDEAMELVYWAARHRLRKVREHSDDQQNARDWAIAVAYLRNQGFRMIRLTELMRIHRSPGD